jgi:hypothetical protein
VGGAWLAISALCSCAGGSEKSDSGGTSGTAEAGSAGDSGGKSGGVGGDDARGGDAGASNELGGGGGARSAGGASAAAGSEAAGAGGAPDGAGASGGADASGGAGASGAAGASGSTAASGGAGASGSAGTSGAAGASAGSGGASERCYPQPPGDGAPCPLEWLGTACHYEDCGGAGWTLSICSSKDVGLGNLQRGWWMSRWPCGSEVQCAGADGNTCDVNQVCLVRQGGALLSDCVEHSCGTGPIGCDCVEGCSGQCVTTGGEQGPSIICNTCSDPRGCP